MMFRDMIRGWFTDYDSGYNEFVRALLADNLRAMNVYMNRVAVNTFSFGIPAEQIRRYGFAFRGKEVLIGKG